jgi:hypothetical protein
MGFRRLARAHVPERPPATDEPSGSCRRTAAVGSFTGTFHTCFAGWGARASTFGAADDARYAEDR